MNLTDRGINLYNMHKDVMNMNDERLYHIWIALIPDGMDWLEAIEVAEDNEIYDRAIELYAALRKMSER